MENKTESQKTKMVDVLRCLARIDSRNAPECSEPPLISAFVTREQETIAPLVMPTAGLVVVIEGRKEVIDGVEHHVYGAGDAFVLPAQARIDVVNAPNPDTGFYRALFVRFPRELIIEAARLWPQFVYKDNLPNATRVSADLCSAIFHAAEAFSRKISTSRRIVDHRVLEIILVLAEQGALTLSPKYVDGSVIDAVRLVVRHRLHYTWTAAKIAAELSMSEATLRRRLRSEGQVLQDVLRDERMKAAYIVLADRDADVADALAATGYRSRSHFARHFQQRFGMTPSSARRQKSGDAAA